MTSLNIVRVLDALERASMEQSKKGETDDWVKRGVLVARVLVEYPRLTTSSVPVLVSRYLGEAVDDGYVEKEKRGRNVFYRITSEGALFSLGRRDQLDDNVTPWYEKGVYYGYMSYVVSPAGSPLIIEGHRDEGSLYGVGEVDDFMKKIKEKNPGLRSMYLRFE